MQAAQPPYTPDASSQFTLDEATLTRLAQTLGAQLRPGDMVGLWGDLGSGKTTFARALITSLLDTPEDVPSPTFTLVQTYDTQVGLLWHADLYRLSDPDEVPELGLADAFDTEIALVEWPDRLGPYLPRERLDVTLIHLSDPEVRGVSLSGSWSGLSNLIEATTTFA